MTVNEIIELLDKEGNKYGGATGKERELKLSINGGFIGTITSAKLDGWGDGLITDVTLEVEVSRIEYHDDEIIAKAIDEFADRLSKYLNVESATKYGNKDAEQQRNSYDTLMKYEIADAIDDIAEQMKAGGIDG